MNRGRNIQVLLFVWLVFSFLDCALVLIQSALGRYGNQTLEVWSWIGTGIIPAFSLLLTTALTESAIRWHEGQGSAFKFAVTLSISVAYLASITLIILIEPFSRLTTFDLFDNTSLFIAIAQGIVVTSICAVVFEGR